MSKFLFASLFLFQFSALGASFKYEVSHYPEVGSCHEVAASLAKRVSEHLVQPAKGRCVSIEKTGFKIEVKYQAEKELPIHSTYTPFGLIYDFAAFATKKECDQALPEWTSTFNRNTRLQPLVAYCFNTHPNTVSRLNWGIRIDGIGEAIKRPVAAGLLIHGRPMDYPANTFAQTVAEKLDPTGIEFAHARFRYRSSEYQLDLIYYTDGPSIYSRRVAEFRRGRDCEAEMGDAKALLAQTMSEPGFLFCTKNYVQGSDLMGIFTEATPKIWFAAERMGSYQECVEKKPALIETYHSLGYSKVVGGVCSKVGSDYKLALVSTE